MIYCNDLIKRAIKQNFILTKFLDTAEASEFRKIKSKEVNLFFNGGYEEAERVRVMIVTKDQNSPNLEEFEISALEILPEAMNRPITHRHVLGTLMSLGIKRETIGDILIEDNKMICFVVKEMVNFIMTNVYEINQIPVKIKESNLNQIQIQEKKEEKYINVASLRLDAVLARTLNLSRNRAVEMITQHLVQINHIECLNNSYILKMGDTMSIRHYGRIQVIEIVNTTKKDRLVVKVDIKH